MAKFQKAYSVALYDINQIISAFEDGEHSEHALHEFKGTGNNYSVSLGDLEKVGKLFGLSIYPFANGKNMFDYDAEINIMNSTGHYYENFNPGQLKRIEILARIEGPQLLTMKTTVLLLDMDNGKTWETNNIITYSGSFSVCWEDEYNDDKPL